MPVDAVRDSRAKRRVRQIWDWVWPTLDRSSGNTRSECEKLDLEVKVDARSEVVREVYGRLSAEFEAETERRRGVETKLLAIGSVAPIAVTIMVAAVSFLSSGRVRDFVPVSVIVISIMAFYVALQFLCAMLAAIGGVSRKKYNVSNISEIMPNGEEDLNGYLRKTCGELAQRIEQHREMTNTKVSQLAVAHQAMRNAVRALVVGLLILVGVIVWETCCAP